MERFISTLTFLGVTLLSPAQATPAGKPIMVLSQKSMDLTTRNPNSMVNEVFADNILLTLHYLKGDVDFLKDEKGKINWEKVRQPFELSFTLNPGQTFVYHETVLSEFKGKNLLVSPAKFWASQGYKSDGWLIGDGVCHLATFLNWVASEAGLETIAKVNHDFLPVPGVPRRYGASIFYTPDGSRNSANQNLYLTNNFSGPINFNISVSKDQVTIQISTDGPVLHEVPSSFVI